MNRLPWYKHFPEDHLVSSADLTPEEEGVLLRLRDRSWIHGPLSEPADQLAKLIRAPRSTARIAALLQRFFTATEAGFISPDLESQRQHATGKRAHLSIAGKEGAASRWNNKPIAIPMANATATPRQKLPYARSGISIGEVSTDLANGTEGEAVKKLMPSWGAA